MLTRLSLVVLAVLVALPAAPAEVEEILVTARRKSESLFDTPVTVTAIDEQTIRDLRIRDVQSMIDLIPNATVPNDPQGFVTFINIRGIRQNDPQSEPNFGLYRNGIFYGGHRANLRAQVDGERVEVLRGPQGGTFGRNAVGGAMNVVFATPKPDPEGYARVSYGRFQRSELEGMVNLPINDRFQTRVAAWRFDQNEGEFYNVTLDNELDEQTDTGGRLSAHLDITDNLAVTWMAEAQDYEGPSARTYGPDGVSNFINGALSRAETPRHIYRDTDPELEFQDYYYSQDLALTTDFGTFNLLASYRDYDMDSTEDQDGADFDPSSGPFVGKSILTREERVQNRYFELLWTSKEDRALTWVAGVSYFDEEFDFERLFETFLDFTVSGIAPLGVRSASGALPVSTPIETESKSAFAELTYALGDTIDLIGSIRWTSEDKSIEYSQYIFSDDPVSLPIFQILFAGAVPTYSLDETENYEKWSPGGGVRWQPNENVSVYATVQTGFRAGSFNTTSTRPEFIPYGQEEAINYELGTKTRWLEGKLGLNLAAFYMNQDDLVLRRDDPFDDSFGFSYLDNVGEGENWGIELETFAIVNEWLSVSGSVGWLNAEISDGETETSPGVFVDLSGNQIPYTRDWTANLRIDFEHPVGGGWQAIAYINGRYEDGGYLDEMETIDFESQELVDVAVGLQNGPYRVVWFGDNILDDKEELFRFFNGWQSQSTGYRWGVEFSMTL